MERVGYGREVGHCLDEAPPPSLSTKRSEASLNSKGMDEARKAWSLHIFIMRVSIL